MTKYFLLAVGVLLICGTMYAHHGSASAFDYTSRITVKATVTEYDWTNPHVLLKYDVKNDKGETEHWTMEMPSPGTLVGAGVYKSTFKTGDAVLASFVGAKDNRPYASCGEIVIVANEQKVNAAQCFGVPNNDLTKLPVKAGYTAVEVKDFPIWPRQGQQQAQTQPQQ
jgi:hypothetical protein